MFRRTPKVISGLAGAPSTDNFEELLQQNLKLRQELGAALAKAQPEWHMSRGGLQFGPYSAADLSAMAEVGMLRADDFLWKPGFDTWKPASDLPGLLKSLSLPLEEEPKHKFDALRRLKLWRKPQSSGP